MPKPLIQTTDSLSIGRDGIPPHLRSIAWIATLIVMLTLTSLVQPRAGAQVQPGITYPQPGNSISGQVTLMGTATTGLFQRYEIYHKLSEAEDDAYTLFISHDEPVTQGELGVWDTDLVQPGEYTLRLRVVKQDGNYVDYTTENIFVNVAPTPTATPTSPTAEIATVEESQALSVAGPAAGPAVRTLSALGYGRAAAVPDRAMVRLYLRRNDAPLVNQENIQQTVTILQNVGVSGDSIVKRTPFSRTPDGSTVGEVAFTTSQPGGLADLLAGIQNQLTDPNLEIADISTQFLVDNCDTLEQQAFERALSRARERAQVLSSVRGESLGDLLAVQELTTPDAPFAGCLQSSVSPHQTLRNDPDQSEIGVVLLATFALGDATDEPVPVTPETDDAGSPLPTPTPTPTPTQ